MLTISTSLASMPALLCGAHALGLALWVGQDVVRCIGVDPVADDLGENVCVAGLSVFEALGV